MQTYQTKGRTQILEFFRKNDGQFSADQVASALPEIGKSSVYRLLPKLAEEGLLQKVTVDKRRLYSYLFENCHRHLHAECTSCGSLIHLDEKTSHEIESGLERIGLHFDERSVLPCLCRECQKKL